MTATGNNYAEALFMLAREENLIDEFYEGLKMVEEVFVETPEYLQFLATPSIPKSERTAALTAAFEGKINAHVLSFLCIMCEQGKTEQFFESAMTELRPYAFKWAIFLLTVLLEIVLTISKTNKRRLANKPSFIC